MAVLFIAVAVRLGHENIFDQISAEESRLDIHLIHDQIVLGIQIHHNPN